MVCRRWLPVVVLVALTAEPAAADEFESNGVKIHYVVQGRGDALDAHSAK